MNARIARHLLLGIIAATAACNTEQTEGKNTRFGAAGAADVADARASRANERNARRQAAPPVMADMRKGAVLGLAAATSARVASPEALPASAQQAGAPSMIIRNGMAPLQ